MAPESTTMSTSANRLVSARFTTALTTRPELRRVDAVLGELQLQVLPVHAHLLRRVRDVAMVPPERLFDELPLEALDHALLRDAERARTLVGPRGNLRVAKHGGGEVGEPDLGTGGEGHGLLEGVLELADVPLPLVRAERPVGIGGECLRLALELRRDRREEVLDEDRHVLHPLAERGQHDRDDVQPVVEILAEAAAPHLALEVLVGRRDDADVHPDGAVAADALELALLQHAQDLGLRLEAHVADLVEQEGPAVGDLELAFARRRRAGEGPLLVAEELALDAL